MAIEQLFKINRNNINTIIKECLKYKRDANIALEIYNSSKKLYNIGKFREDYTTYKKECMQFQMSFVYDYIYFNDYNSLFDKKII